jgi:hypothetical protein
MGGYGFPTQTPQQEADPLRNSLVRMENAKARGAEAQAGQGDMANMFRMLLMAALFGSTPQGMGGQPQAGGKMGPASQIPGFDPSMIQRLLGRGGNTSPFNPSYGQGAGLPPGLLG